jgi:hypothetical protein
MSGEVYFADLGANRMAVSPNQIIQEPIPRPPQENAAGQAGQHIAELLLKAGHISAEQLRYARRVRSKLPSPRTLVSVLQDLHFITSEKLRSTLVSNALAVPLGELLHELGYISEPDLKTALALQSDRPECKLGEILTESRLFPRIRSLRPYHFRWVMSMFPWKILLLTLNSSEQPH